MSQNTDASPSREEQRNSNQTDSSKSMYEALCDNCGIIDCGNEHPTGVYGPECPGCGAILRTVVELEDPDDMRDGAIPSGDLEEARETVSMLDPRWDEADHGLKSKMVLEQV